NGWCVPLVLSRSGVSGYGWLAPRVIGLLVTSLGMLGIFLFVEKRAAEPILPLWLFRESIITVSSIAIFVLGIGMFGVILYVPLFMQGVLGVSATQSGSLLTPLLMAAVISSVAAGQIIGKTGRYRWLAVVGVV